MRPKLEQELRTSPGAYEVATGELLMPPEEPNPPVMMNVTHMANPEYDTTAPAPPIGNMMQDPAAGAEIGAMIPIPSHIPNPEAPAGNGAAAARTAALEELRYLYDIAVKRNRIDRERFDTGKAAFFKIVLRVIGSSGLSVVSVEIGRGDPHATWQKWVQHGEPVEASSRIGLMNLLMTIDWEPDESMDGLISRIDQLYRLLSAYPGAVDIDEDMKKSRLFACVTGDRERGLKYETKISAVSNPLDPAQVCTYEQAKTLLVNEEQAINAKGGYRHNHRDGGGKERTYARVTTEDFVDQVFPGGATRAGPDDLLRSRVRRRPLRQRLPEFAAVPRLPQASPKGDQVHLEEMPERYRPNRLQQR